MASGSDDGDDGGGEAADGGEQGVEGEVVQLDAEEHHSGDDPRNGHVTPSSWSQDTWPTVRRDRQVRDSEGNPTREVVMKALQLTALKHGPEFREVPDPDPGPARS